MLFDKLIEERETQAAESLRMRTVFRRKPLGWVVSNKTLAIPVFLCHHLTCFDLRQLRLIRVSCEGARYTVNHLE